ncbi:MAG: Dabb family protein [Defluviitaleaceae bacterium]|nr:Dabb family protein [Defluviitaleaceae bacterium]
MVRHIVAWNYKDGFSASENQANAKKVKLELEALKHTIKGIIQITVHINLLPSSNKDLVLDSVFESEEALAAYQVHPEHKRVSAFVGTVTQNRACVDYHE